MTDAPTPTAEYGRATPDGDLVDRREMARRLSVDVRSVDRKVRRGELPRPCLGEGGRPRGLWSFVVDVLRRRHARQTKLDQRAARKLK